MTEPQHQPNEGAAEAGEVEAPALDLELPEDPAEAVEVLTEVLLEARTEAAGYLDHWQRVAAEFDNFRKRSQREHTEIVSRAAERVLVGLLPTLDSFDAAVAFEAETEKEEKLLAGMHGTLTQLLTALQAEGLEPIQALGAEFDPELHEAVQVDEGSGTMVVTRELRRGYLLNGRVLRAALVAVGYEAGGGSNE
jgi:molecular chaperone GrpE